MDELSEKLIEQRRQMKPPASYPTRENISEFKEVLNGTLRVCSGSATVDSFDVSDAASGEILITTSDKQIKILDASGVLKETIPIDNRVSKAKFAASSDSIAVLAFAGSLKA